MQFRWRSFKKIVRLWVDLFDRHNLLTYASAIALRTFIAAVACTLFSLGLLGAAHERRLWKDTIGPQIEPKVLPHVFDGIDQTVQRVFGSSSAGLLALANAAAKIDGTYITPIETHNPMELSEIGRASCRERV